MARLNNGFAACTSDTERSGPSDAKIRDQIATEVFIVVIHKIEEMFGYIKIKMIAMFDE